MKRKFSKILGIGLTLALLASLLLVAAPVSADATAVTDVYVDFLFGDIQNRSDDSSGNNEYLIHFKPANALSRGSDWVTVTFPDGVGTTMGPATFTMGGVSASQASFSTDFGTAFSATWVDSTVAATITQYRVKVRMPIDVAAGADVWLSIDSGNIKAPDESDSNWKVYVQTTQDTARVISSAFRLDDSTISDTNDILVVTPNTVGVAAEYKLSFDVVTTGATTVTVKFPVGVVLPDDMDITEVLFSVGGSSWFNASSTPVIDVDRRTVTAATTLNLEAGGALNYIKIVQGAGVTNPTKARAINTYRAMIKTAKDGQWVWMDLATEIVADTATKLVFVASASDNATIVNALTQVIKLESQDQYGNKKAVTGTTVLVVTDGTGAVHTAASNSPWGISQSHGSGSDDVYYLPTAVGTGTHTLTATVVSGTTLTSDTFDVSVVPAVVLTDPDGNELGTYGPSFSYNANIVSGTYILNAINAAGAGDTVTLGDGIYEVTSSGLTVATAITVTSVNGRDSTTIRMPHNTDNYLFTLSTIGSTISGLHLLGYLPSETPDFANENYGVKTNTSAAADAYGYIKDNKIEGFYNGISNADSAVDFWKIQDNVLDNNKIGIYANNMSDWTISGNTITNYMFGIGGLYTNITDVSIKNNSFNGITSSVLTAILKMGANQQGIELAVDIATLVITQNTFTGNDYGIKLGANVPLTVVKYNDFIDNNLFGIGTTSASRDVLAELNWWGDATGPSTGSGTYASTATGSGDAVSKDVAPYAPWLHKSKVDVVDDNASYITLTRSLAVGWNTLSVPAKLIAGADGLNDLVSSGVSIAYTYSASGGWQPITTNLVINPLDAVYIKMSSAQTVLLKIDAGATSAPTKSLAAGWNLIGLASITTQQEVTALASLATTSYGLLVSPSMNADEWVYVAGAGNAKSLAIGEGYWIFMKSTATIAGLTILPLAPSLN